MMCIERPPATLTALALAAVLAACGGGIGIIKPSTKAFLTTGWDYPFQESATVDGPFTLLDGSQVTVPLMHEETRLTYVDGEGYQAVQLPYAGQGGGHVGYPAGGGPVR